MSKGKYLGEFEILVMMGLLRLGDDAYGMRVLEEIENEGGRTVSIGAVYATLSRLEQKGLVRSRLTEPTAERGGRAKRVFDVSASGRRALSRSLESLTRMASGLSLGWGA
ncbi:MAG: PadR family transcriptional regulator [bacterium]|nr:PadR family transcriptional regulator [bacterium]